MQVTINLDHAALDSLGITIEQFEQAAGAALSNLVHPESGAPIYFNDVRVTAIADCPELEVKSLFNLDDTDHKMIFAPTRTGMSAGMNWPPVLDQTDGPKR
jgi:hypothetical protein